MSSGLDLRSLVLRSMRLVGGAHWTLGGTRTGSAASYGMCRLGPPIWARLFCADHRMQCSVNAAEEIVGLRTIRADPWRPLALHDPAAPDQSVGELGARYGLSWNSGRFTTLSCPRAFGVVLAPFLLCQGRSSPRLFEGAKLVHLSEFALTSEAFTQRGEIPRRHTCEGDDVSPALAWSDPPPGTRTLALIVDDPDAPIGTFTHWLAWNIDPSAGGLAAGESAPAEGRNDFGAGGWSGPCPPPGHGAHRYFFRLYALEATLDVGFRAGRREVERALEGHVLATAELIGTFER